MKTPTQPASVTIAGRECLLKYPISAMKAIEAELGHSILKLANMASDADISLAALEAVIFHGLRGADDALPRPKVEQLIENDYVGSLQAFTTAITTALGVDDGNKSNSGSDEAPEALGE